MPKGKVKWFSDAKGYGFIQQDDGAPDIFVHYTEIDGRGFRTLQEGMMVEFEVQQSPKGVKAIAVKRTEG